MKKTLAFLFLSCFAGLLTANAQAGTESFRETCSVRYEDSYSIQADCLDTAGNYIPNNYRRGFCPGDLANMNGYITCNGGNGGSYPPPGGGYLPQGSYQQTCEGCFVRGSVLQCSCQDTRGYMNRTSLNFRRCRGDIANWDGRLTCG